MLTLTQIVFLVAAAITLLAALRVVTSRSMVHAALWLIMALAGVAVFFVLLNAGFLAVVQVAVYIDAIAIMIIIVVMLTQRSMGGQDRQKNKSWWAGLIAALLLFGGLVLMFTEAPLLTVLAPALTMGPEAMVEELGLALVDVDRYILPFEVASVLLLAALVGSIIVAWPGRKSQEQEDES
ncbi:MAG TPA: NADH-quinone oxidoreductase subunit J [Anaerolineales bacterium]|nr:NADH-quinone oxidoreductase subunit J [Anaerolineales bacterium]